MSEKTVVREVVKGGDTATNGLAPPKFTTTQMNAIANPQEGRVIYNTTAKVLYFHNGTAWGAV